jgi:hypothetical protein
MERTTDGTAMVTRPGPLPMLREQRAIRYRYGGRMLLMVLGALGFIVLLNLHMWLYSSLVMLAVSVVQAGIISRMRADLRWVAEADRIERR